MKLEALELLEGKNRKRENGDQSLSVTNKIHGIVGIKILWLELGSGTVERKWNSIVSAVVRGAWELDWRRRGGTRLLQNIINFQFMRFFLSVQFLKFLEKLKVGQKLEVLAFGEAGKCQL